MGFMDCQVLRGSEYSVSDAPVASDHPQCSESFGGKQYRTFGCTMAGKELFDFTLYVHKIRLISSPLVAVCMYLHCVVFFFVQGMLTGLLGNLSLLSYFAKKREKEAAVVQTLGVISTHVVLAQLTMAGAMPMPFFVATSAVVTLGVILNYLFYFGKLSATLWRLWEDFITVGGLSVLPQVSFFYPFTSS